MWLPDEAVDDVSAIPAHVPRILRRSDVAKVLKLDPERVRYLTRRGKIPLLNEGWRDRCEWREYSPEQINEYAKSRQLTPNWDALNE